MSNYILVAGNTSSHDGNAIDIGTSKTKAGGITIAYVTLGVAKDLLDHPANSINTSNTSGKTKYAGKAVAANGASTVCEASLVATNTKTKIC